MKHFKKTKKPLVLTINGEAEAVVQDAEAYQRLLDIAAQADALEGTKASKTQRRVVCVPRVKLWRCSAATMPYLVRLADRALRDMEPSMNSLMRKPPKACEHSITALGCAPHGSTNGWRRDTGDYVATVEALLNAGAKAPEVTDHPEASEPVRDLLKQYFC